MTCDCNHCQNDCQGKGVGKGQGLGQTHTTTNEGRRVQVDPKATERDFFAVSELNSRLRSTSQSVKDRLQHAPYNLGGVTAPGSGGMLTKGRPSVGGRSQRSNGGTSQPQPQPRPQQTSSSSSSSASESSSSSSSSAILQESTRYAQTKPNRLITLRSDPPTLEGIVITYCRILLLFHTILFLRTSIFVLTLCCQPIVSKCPSYKRCRNSTSLYCHINLPMFFLHLIRYVQAVSSVLRLGRSGALTDHSSVLFDVGVQGVTASGHANPNNALNSLYNCFPGTVGHDSTSPMGYDHLMCAPYLFLSHP